MTLILTLSLAVIVVIMLTAIHSGIRQIGEMVPAKTQEQILQEENAQLRQENADLAIRASRTEYR